MLNGSSRLLIGLGMDVKIGRTNLCFGWKNSLQFVKNHTDQHALVPIQIAPPNGAHPPINLITDDKALDQWATDSFDMVVIHVPLRENADNTFKQLIRVARQGLILLGITHS